MGGLLQVGAFRKLEVIAHFLFFFFFFFLFFFFFFFTPTSSIRSDYRPWMN